MKKFICLLALWCSLPLFSKSIDNGGYIENLILKIDTLYFSSEASTYEYQKEKYLFFKSLTNQDVCEITLYPNEDTLIQSIKLLPGNDFQLIDSMQHLNEAYYRGKIKFSGLENAKHLSMIFEIKLKSGKKFNQEFKLFPYADTYIAYDNEPIDLFLDEEKVIELPCLNVYNIRMDGDWTDLSDYEVKLSAALNALRINVKPKILGSKVITIRLRTHKPFVGSDGKLSFDLNPIRLRFNVKPNRIDYINPDKFTIFFNPDFKAADDIQFDYNRNMGLRKTYRIEDQAENGGNLIAEIFTQSQVGNSNKVLCKIRTFALHKVNEGYLYMKDGDKTRFLTNFNIIEKPRIDEISLLHDGDLEWSNNLAVYPGERFEIRVKGTGMQQSALQFEGIENVTRDTTRLSDEVAFFVAKIPLSFPKKKVNVFMNGKSTQYSLFVREFQSPTDFDFILVNYDGNRNIPLADNHFNKPIFYEGTLNDINLLFDGNKIDEKGKLYGKQYIDIEVRVMDARNTLIEVQNINNVAVCPDENSPRYNYYDRKDCHKTLSINLNDYLLRKTYAYEPWTQVFITVKHNEGKHGQNGLTRKVKLILKRKYFFDVQVSFPAGLLQYRFRDESDNLNNFYGISLAFIAQFQFYEGNVINKFKPYSFGAGFIAIDAFNFSQNNDNRDLGIVGLLTLTPIQRTKLSFPIYAGGGYLVNYRSWFVLFGPGLTIRF